MKKRTVISLLAAAVLMLSACAKKTETVPSGAEQQNQVTEAETLVYTGIYRQPWSEEIGGTVVEMNSYIVLNEDHTGYWIAQDVGTLTWDESRLTLTVGASYDIALTQENDLLLYKFQDDNGVWMPTTFEKIEKLPAEIEKMLPNS